MLIDLGYPEDPFVVGWGEGVAIQNTVDLMAGDGIILNGAVTAF